MRAVNGLTALALAGAALLAACTSASGHEPVNPNTPPTGGAPAADAGALGPSSDTASAGDGNPMDPEPSFTDEERAILATLSPAMLPPPPADVSNAFGDDAQAAALGKKLFFAKELSGKLLDGDNNGDPQTLGKKGEAGKVACTGCHVPERDFNDTRSPSAQISLGSGWGRRRAPSLLDVGQAKLLMWDGRHDALYNQVFGPFESAVEMNSSRLYVAEQIWANYRTDYEAVFGPITAPLGDAARFPPLTGETTGCRSLDADDVGVDCHGMPGDQAEYDGMSAADRDAVTRIVVNVGKAIAAYERLLACGPSRFDAWMHGDKAALSRAEQRGAAVFVGRGRCASCHSGPFLSDQQFHNVGLAPAQVAAAFVDTDDRGALVGLATAITDPLSTNGAYSDGNDGRLPTTIASTLEGAFRTPMLRCVGKRPSFFHTGQAKTLEAVIAFFVAGGSPGGFPGTREITPLPLSDLDKSDLAAFLRSLSGDGASSQLITP